ncbi:hypothetical protein H3143_01170 [Mycoplasma tullyi]|uniref:Uncharacterized protein n=1 Tax=Mycoplasma tullyi TaxID=1612150 RepID=A0A7D7U4D9_9MOLU|nr:hypothetical protein [Mycoplasma tullyi]QMT98729.1 hypothetical protein H3143_01170 [Mycoplasma tullyi]
MDKNTDQINKNELKKEIDNYCKELVNSYSDWANQIKVLTDPKQIHKLSLKFGKEIIDLNQQITKLTITNGIKRPDYSKYTKPRISSINATLKRSLNKTNYDYIFQSSSRSDFIQKEQEFKTQQALDKLEKNIHSQLITDDYRDKRSHNYLLHWYSKSLKTPEEELLKNKEFVKCFIESCIDYENCYELNFDQNNKSRKLEYATCADLNHKHKNIQWVNKKYSLTTDNCIFYIQKPIRKFYWNIHYKYLQDDAWIYGENNETQLAKINDLYNSYLNDPVNKENLKIFGKTDKKVCEFNLSKDTLLGFKEESKIQQFIQFFLIHQAKWHKKISYLNFEYIFKKEIMDLVIEDLDLNKLDYLVIYLNNLNGINFLDLKIWQIVDFLKTVNKNLNNGSKVKIIFFNNINTNRIISRLKKWYPQNDYEDLKQSLGELFLDNKNVVNFWFAKTKNNSKKEIVNADIQNQDIAKIDGKNGLLELKNLLDKHERFFNELQNFIDSHKESELTKKSLTTYVNYAVKLIRDISSFLNDIKINPIDVQRNNEMWTKIKLIYKLGHLDKNLSRKVGEAINDSLFGYYFN